MKLKTLLLPAFAAALCSVSAFGALSPRDGYGPLKFMPYKMAENHGLQAAAKKGMASRVPMKVSTEGRPEIYGNSLSGKVGYGMYSWYAEPNTSFVKAADTPPFFGSAVYVNGKYYGCDYDYDSSFALTYVRWYVYDAETWQCEKIIENPLDFSYIATDRTYDASTGTVYSIVYDKTGSSIWLATTALADGASTMIAPLDKDVITIAANAEGELFGIDTSANLYRISKTTAALSLVGNTAIYDDYLSDYTQSICIDQRTGKIYWSEFHTEGLFTSLSSLYEVDSATAATLKVTDIPGNPEIVGTYVSEYIEEGVPGNITDLKAVSAAVGSNSHTFTFTAPTKTSGGLSLGSAVLSCEVSVDGDLMDILDVTPGQKVVSGPFDIPRGLHTLKVVLENNVGSGEPAVAMFFSGYDVPAAPANLTLVNDGDGAILTWDAPEGGAEGGAVRFPVAYTVVRMPGNVKVAEGITATRFTEPLPNAARYSYKVSASSQEGTGPEAESQAVVIGAVSTPYTCSFDSQQQFDVYTIVDIASEGRVWNYDEDNKRMRHPWSAMNDIDDYAATPGIRMSGSKAYTVSFDAYQWVDSYNEHVQLWFGPSTNIEDMEMLLDTGKLPVDAVNFKASVAPPADGVYYFAFRSTAAKNGFMSYVDNVKVIESGVSNVPAAVNNLSARGAANGVEAVDISFDAPTTTMQGSPLNSIKRIDVNVDNSLQPVKTILAPTPGEHYSFTDASAGYGKHIYQITAYTDNGAGLTAEAEAFAGTDVPMAPTNVVMSGEEGNRLISWDAPVAGVNGGNMDGVLSFCVKRVVNNQEEVIADGITETSYTDTWKTDCQAFIYYSVTSVTSAGTSDAVCTDSYAAGDPYPLPYYESFAGGNTSTNPWSVEQASGLQGSWLVKESGENPYVSAQDGDKGLVTFDGYHSWTNNCELRLISPVINISEYVDPVLSFHIYHWNGETWGGDYEDVNETLQIEISVDGKAFEPIPGAFWQLYRAKKGWQNYTADLSKYYRSKGVRVAFRGKSAGCFNIHIDNIAVTGTKESTGVDSVDADMFSVFGVKGAIQFSGAESGIYVYDMAGRLVKADNREEGELDIIPGIYLVNCKQNTIKVVVK